MRLPLRVFPWLVVGFSALTALVCPAAERAAAGLQALYDFRSAEGATVRDRSGVGEPLDLTIADPQAVAWGAGSLEIRKPTAISSKQPARKLTDAIRTTGELTIEAWVRSSSGDQVGPARMVTLSKDSSNRNFTLGQDKNRVEVRLRSRKTSDNGIPAVSSDPRTFGTELAHLVYTRSRGGAARIFRDGKVIEEGEVPGSLDNWNDDYRLALGNEVTNDRPWLGTYHLVAIYNRALRDDEVAANFAAGAGAGAPVLVAENAGATLFESKIAPLLADRCLECHDASTRKGKLDLSRKATAGAADMEELWHSVDSGEMPDDRPPLEPEEKALLKEWIDGGATWSLESIDPADYLHGSQDDTLWVQRLTVPEYIATVRAATGVDIEEAAREALPADLRADGFSNTAYNLNVDLGHVEAYGQLAETIVGRMDIPEFAKRFSRSKELTDKSMAALIEPMGVWLLRGPLSEDEVILYRGVSTSVAAAGGDFDEAAGMIVEAMLQSPRFLYRIERQRGDGGGWPVNDYELASRLSYILWGAPPDETLYRLAKEGKLHDAKNLGEQAARMLDDPRAVGRSLQFAADWLHLGRLSNLCPDAERFPDWNAGLAADMRAESLAYFREIVWGQGRPLSDLLNAQLTFLTPRLAEHYGIDPQGDGATPARYDLADIPHRGGVLTQGSVLTVGGDGASMVSRGLFVLHDLLRGVVKDPPPCVDVTPVPTKPGLTQRDIALERINSKSCGGCHAKFEPLAFGLEKFDGLGTFHASDAHGNALREDGEILVPGTAEPVPYRTSAELMDLLAASDRVRETLTWKLVQFSLGRPLSAADVPAVRGVHRAAQENGGTYRAVLTALVTSELVLTISTEKS